MCYINYVVYYKNVHYVLYYTTKNIFQMISFFLYSPCPNLESIKNALCYKFRRPTIGQNCSAICTNKGGHRDAFSNEWHKVLRVLRGLLLSLERSKRQGLFFDIMALMRIKKNRNNYT